MTLQALKQFKNPTQLWSGYTALAARNLPFTAMQFPMFEHLKSVIKGRREKNRTATGSLMETALITGFSAGSAGSVAAVITTPVDVVKTRVMLSAAGESSEVEAARKIQIAKTKGQSLDHLLVATKTGSRKSGLTIAREVIKQDGIKGLFRGGLLRGVWTALGSGLYLGVYESGRVWLEDRHESED